MKHTLIPFISVLITITATMFSMAQQPTPQMVQEKLGSVKQAAAANQAALHQYQWTESMQVSLGSLQRPSRQFSCKYGPGGSVQKTPVEGTQQQPSGSGSKLLETKVDQIVEQMKDYMDRVQNLMGQYIPPDPVKMQKAYAAGNAKINTSTPGMLQMTFRNYVQNGDTLTFTFNENTKKMSNLNIASFLDDPSDSVKVSVQFASLPDGTNYPSQTTINAAAKNLTVTTTNSNYQQISAR